MNIRTLCLGLLLGVFSPALARAMGDPPALGQAGAFLRLGIGARAGSLGDAYVAAASGPTALFWNPAGIGRQRLWQFEASQRRFAMDRVFSFAGVTFPLGRRVALGVGWIGFSADGIEARVSNTIEPDGYFSDSENAVLLAASYRLAEWLSVGSTARMVKHQLFNVSAAGYSVSAGANLHVHERLTFGANYQDFHSTFEWQDGPSETFPPTRMFGAAWQTGAHSLLTLDYHETEREPGRVRAGMELTTISSLPLRLGYSRNAFAAGAGVETSLGSHQLRIDYHFSSNDGINGHAHAFSVAMDFNRGDARYSRDFAASEKIRSARKQPPPEEWKHTAQAVDQRVRITTAQLNVRSGPGVHYEVISTIEQGTVILATRRWQDWYEIKFGKTKSGWVSREFVEEM